MKLLPMYKRLAGSQNDFTRQFNDNDQLFNQARAFWNQLESSMPFVFLVMIVVSILSAVFYYTYFNKKPGRHYTPKYWFIFLIITIVISFFITLVMEYSMATPRLNGALNLEIMVSIGNAIYSSIIYFIMSVLWCYFGQTNAYRLFKF